MAKQRWMRVMVEVYQSDHYEGRWEIDNGDVGMDLDYARSCVRSIRDDDRYLGAKLVFLQDGDNLVIGVFCGREPPGKPKSGNALPAEMFESSD
jgi:hypothetical protein